MNKDILRKFIRSILEEEVANNAHVPQQLIPADGSSNDEDKDKENSSDNVREFSGVAGIAGGMVPTGPRRRKR